MRAAVLLVLAALISAFWAFDAYEYAGHHRVAARSKSNTKVKKSITRWRRHVISLSRLPDGFHSFALRANVGF
jgi:uncharacterized membrane protein YdjX (TVP38/TMEM64 family)